MVILRVQPDIAARFADGAAIDKEKLRIAVGPRQLWPAGETAHVVATVPPQHMYGMELSVLLPLLRELTNPNV